MKKIVLKYSYAITILLALALLISACGDDEGGGGSGGGSSSVVAVRMITRIQVGSSPPREGCTGDIQWTLTPVSLTGKDGKDTVITEKETYKTSATSDSWSDTAGDYACFPSKIFNGLKAGKWRLEAVIPQKWSASCEKDIVVTSGWTEARFTLGESGCK